MKKLFFLTGFSLLYLSAAVAVFSQEEDETLYIKDDKTVYSIEEDERPPLVFLFSEGNAVSWLTRIIKQSGRSNFVFKDFLPGLYFRVDMPLTKIITPMTRIAVYYPLISTFNQIPQKPNTPLHYGADMNFGFKFDILEFKYFRLNAGPALHLFYLNSERWNYFNLGAAAFLGMELPVAQRWTLICNGLASLDNGNFGGNRTMEPFDIVYQYQVDIGMRYSRKQFNRTSLFPGNPAASEMPLFSR
jgi:hypothetical protein